MDKRIELSASTPLRPITGGTTAIANRLTWVATCVALLFVAIACDKPTRPSIHRRASSSAPSVANTSSAMQWTTDIGTFTQTPQPFDNSLFANVWAISLSGDSSVGTTCRPPCDGTTGFGFMPEDLTRVIAVPGIGGSPRSVNDAGDVAGFYGLFGAFRGFLLHGGAYSTIDVPGAQQTQPFGINNAGTIVGDYFTPATRAFVYAGGTFTSLELPDSFDACNTRAAAINSEGSIVGTYQVARPHLPCGGPLRSYIRHPDGAFTAFEATADATATGAHGINDHGDIVGHYNTPDGKMHGFLLPGNGEPAFTFDFPHQTGGTSANGVDNSGQVIVGWYGPDVGSGRPYKLTLCGGHCDSTR